ncbi:MAG TPA: HAD-IA family hydrolase [Longimicrobium sp.]|nr:HAD-IA family hydrolase [Longimicrobium sp.]
MPSPIRAVLYDFDGTLADSTELIMQCWRHTMNKHLGHCPPDEEWLSGFGRTLVDQLARFARSEAEHQAMLESYRVHQNALFDTVLKPFPGAEATVAELARRGVRLAIVTSRLRRATLRGLDICGLASHFDVVVTPDDVAKPKPDPESVILALQRLGVAAEEALFVGDSPYDMAAGRAAGTRTAAALWGPFTRAALEEAGADFYLDRQEAVLDLVGGAA